ncbi:unnamed protein product, partial [Rotaria sp. Silwood1]
MDDHPTFKAQLIIKEMKCNENSLANYFHEPSQAAAGPAAVPKNVMTQNQQLYPPPQYQQQYQPPPPPSPKHQAASTS